MYKTGNCNFLSHNFELLASLNLYFDFSSQNCELTSEFMNNSKCFFFSVFTSIVFSFYEKGNCNFISQF